MNINYILNSCETHPSMYLPQVREYIQKLQETIAILNEKNLALEETVESLEKRLTDVIESISLSTRLLEKMVNPHDL